MAKDGIIIPYKKALHTQGMAERGGFEPPHGNYPPAGIRSQSLQPLGYLSTNYILETNDQ